MRNNPALYIFAILSVLFLTYSSSVYLQPLWNGASEEMNFGYAEGKQIWQDNNCQSCHQIYGLGGYLGPDITNVASKYKNREVALKAIIKSGNKRMPAYHLKEKELEDLLSFFQLINESGVSDPRSFQTDNTGMIHQKENDENK